MDHFPIKRGIGLSRTPHPNSQMQPFRKDIPTRPHEQINRTLPPNIAVMNRVPHLTLELNQVVRPGNHQRTPSGGIFNHFQESPGLLDGSSVHPVLSQSLALNLGSQNADIKLNGIANHPKSISATMQSSKNECRLDATMNKSIGLTERLTPRNNIVVVTGGKTNASLSLPPPDSHQNAVVSERSEGKTQTGRKQVLSKCDQFQQTETLPTQEETRKLNEYLRQIEMLKAQNAQLRREMDVLVESGRQNVEKGNKNELQLKSKISSLEYELRLLKGSKNRLQIEVDSSKRLVRMEREKNEKSKQEMNKLIFFEDDLIHAKDYHKLKEEIEYVVRENARLFEDHQTYINEVRDQNRITAEKIAELELLVATLKGELIGLQGKMNECSGKGEDKIVILKLQSEINFLKKKGEEQYGQLCKTETQLEERLIQLQETTVSSSTTIDNHRSVLDEISVKQIQETVLLYQARITDLSEALAKKSEQADRQRKTVELLTSELRKTREDRHINTLKEKSSENNLKNDVEMLRKSYQAEAELKNKKIANLEEFLQRKAKEINLKDKFIKEFLIGRVKDWQDCSMEEVKEGMQLFFSEGSG